MNNKSLIFIPVLIIFVIIFSLIKRKNAYSSFIKGSQDGLNLFKEVFPSILAMLFCVTLLKSSGLIDDLSKLISKIFPKLNNYIEIIPMIIFRPVSGSASVAVLDSICKNDVDGIVCKMASTIQGSTEPTFNACFHFVTPTEVKYKHKT